MDSPRVTILMNARNGAQFIREALDSALVQTYPDWELIVWDDWSTDDTARIVAEYPDPRIRYILSPVDTTLGPSRDLAIQEARGEWVAFLDQDDIWVAEKLALQMEIADRDTERRVGMIYGRTVEFFPDGRQNDFDVRHEFKPLPERDMFTELFRKSCFVMISSAMFRRAALDSIGRIPVEFDLICDFHLFVAVARRWEVRAVDQVICRYRRHATSLSGQRRRAMHEEALLLVARWVPDLPPAVAANARRYHQTLIASIEMSRVETFATGAVRLIRKGSAWYAFSRFPVRLARWALRRMGRARWQAWQREMGGRTQ